MRFATVGSFPQCKWDFGLQLSLCSSIFAAQSLAACVIVLFLELDFVNRIGVAACSCESDLSADFLNFGAIDFPSKNPFN